MYYLFGVAISVSVPLKGMGLWGNSPRSSSMPVAIRLLFSGANRKSSCSLMVWAWELTPRHSTNSADAVNYISLFRIISFYCFRSKRPSVITMSSQPSSFSKALNRPETIRFSKS